MRSLLVLALPLLAAAQGFSEFQKRVTQFTLENGIRFVVFERHEAPVVSFHTYVNAGSAFDPPGQTGMAHMFARMAWKGGQYGSSDWPAEDKALAEIEEAYDRLEAERRKPPAEAPRVSLYEAQLKMAILQANAYAVANPLRTLLELNGAAGLRAAAAPDAIEYSYSLPSNRIELWFLLEAERFRTPVFREFYKERDALAEERRARLEANPQSKLMQAVLAAAFPAHPYGAGEIGRPEDFPKLRARDAGRFFRTHFVPANVSIAMAGDVNPEQAKQLAQKYFASVPASGPAPQVETREPTQQEPRRTEIAITGEPVLCVAYKRPDHNDKDDAVFDVLSVLLGGGRTGLLHDELVRGRHLAVAAAAHPSIPGTRFEHLFTVLIAPTRGTTLEESEKALDSVLETMKSAPPNGARLQRAKAALRAGLLRRMAGNASLAGLLATAQANYGDWSKVLSSFEDVQRVSAADVQRVAGHYFTAERRTTGYARAPERQGARQ